MKITKTYEPNNYEPEIYNLWELSGAFESSGVGPKYSIVMPPPKLRTETFTLATV